MVTNAVSIKYIFTIASSHSNFPDLSGLSLTPYARRMSLWAKSKSLCGGKNAKYI